MRIVVALGGNALLERGQTPDADTQIANVERAVAALAPMAETSEAALVASLVARAALAREESRGAHWRSDHPHQSLPCHTEATVAQDDIATCPMAGLPMAAE